MKFRIVKSPGLINPYHALWFDEDPEHEREWRVLQNSSRATLSEVIGVCQKFIPSPDPEIVAELELYKNSQ